MTNKHRAGVLGASVLIVLCTTQALAVTITQTYQFTAADLMKTVYFGGADGTTAADNGLFDGARLRRDGSSGTGPLASRSYVASQSAAFSSWATTTTDRFLSFNLWGLDGLGARWGEDFKPSDWGTQSGPGGWTPWQTTWTAAGWGTPPAGFITEKFVGWDAGSFADGINFQDAGLASKVFRFTVDFDTTDPWWGGSTNGAPNSLYGPKTFWFGGWFDDDLFAADNDYYMYEGNMVLEAVPEPTTLGLLGIGLLASGLRAVRRRRGSVS